jgi:hypothetical protein
MQHRPSTMAMTTRKQRDDRSVVTTTTSQAIRPQPTVVSTDTGDTFIIKGSIFDIVVVILFRFGIYFSGRNLAKDLCETEKGAVQQNSRKKCLVKVIRLLNIWRSSS